MMKCLILSLFFSLSLSILALAETSPSKGQKLDLLPSSKAQVPAPETSKGVKPSPTGDIDMSQFKNLPPPDKNSKVRADVNCQMPDGAILKLGDAGYKECMEIKANRVMNQPQSPEAAPYDPRTK